MYNVHSWVVGVSDEDSERLVAEIPPELKKLVDADQRTNKEVVKAALWREFGGERLGSLERRVEEKKDRISMIEREKNERKRELDQEQQELEALQSKLELVKDEHQAERNEEKQLWQEAENAISVKEIGGTPVISSKEEYVEKWADKLNLSVDEFKDEIIARKEETND